VAKIDDFREIEMRAGRILAVEASPRRATRVRDELPAWRIAIFDSEVLTLEAIEADGRVILLRPDDAAELGSLVG